MEDLPQKLPIENWFINVEFQENKTGKITAGTYFLSIVEIRNYIYQIEAATLLSVSNYVLGLTWGNDSTIYQLDSPSEGENGNFSSFGTSALLKFDTLRALQVR